MRVKHGWHVAVWALILLGALPAGNADAGGRQPGAAEWKLLRDFALNVFPSSEVYPLPPCLFTYALISKGYRQGVSANMSCHWTSL